MTQSKKTKFKNIYLIKIAVLLFTISFFVQCEALPGEEEEERTVQENPDDPNNPEDNFIEDPGPLASFNNLISVPNPISSELTGSGNRNALIASRVDALESNALPTGDPCKLLGINVQGLYGFINSSGPTYSLLELQQGLQSMYRALCHIQHMRETAGDNFLIRDDYLEQRREELFQEAVGHLQAGEYDESVTAIQRLGVVGYVGEVKDTLVRDYIRTNFSDPQERRHLIQVSDLYQTESIAKYVLAYTNKANDGFSQGLPRRGIASWAGVNRMYLIDQNVIYRNSQQVPTRMLFRRQRIDRTGGYKVNVNFVIDLPGNQIYRRYEFIRRKDSASGDYYIAYRTYTGYENQNEGGVITSSGIIRPENGRTRVVQYTFDEYGDINAVPHVRESSYLIRYSGYNVTSINTSLNLCVQDAALDRPATDQFRRNYIRSLNIGANNCTWGYTTVGSQFNRPYDDTFLSNEEGNLKDRIPFSTVFNAIDEDQIIWEDLFDFSAFSEKFQEARANPNLYPISDGVLSGLGSTPYANHENLIVINR